MLKKKKLHLAKLTVANLSTEEQVKAKGGYVTWLSNCCTVNMATCILYQTQCNPADTYTPGGGVCP